MVVFNRKIFKLKILTESTDLQIVVGDAPVKNFNINMYNIQSLDEFILAGIRKQLHSDAVPVSQFQGIHTVCNSTTCITSENN